MNDRDTITEQALKFLYFYDSLTRNNTAMLQELEPIKVKAIAVLNAQFTLLGHLNDKRPPV